MDREEMLISMLGEIGSIAMGAASVALSELTGSRILFTSPRVWLSDRPMVEHPEDMKVMISVDYRGDISGKSLMLFREDMALKLANLMLKPMNIQVDKLDELASSALMEAMNQMMGSAARALSELTGSFIDITTPKLQILKQGLTDEIIEEITNLMKGKIVSVQFAVLVGGEQTEGHMYLFYPLSLAAKLVIHSLKNLNRDGSE